MTPVERMARAIAVCDGGKITGPGRHKASDEFGWDAGQIYRERYVEAHWREFVGHATFALEAMREPSEAMKAAFDRDFDAWHNEKIEDPYHLWRCMIDAALSET